MKTSTVFPASTLTLVAFLSAVSLTSATYFTSPQSSTVWSTAPGQTITWHFQAGGAAVGDIVLQAVGLSGSGSTVTVASAVDLTTESLTFPSGVALRSNTQQYELMIVNSQDPSYAYATVGPFEIDSFSGSASSGASSSSSSPAASESTTTSADSGLTEGAPRTRTNPPVSTTTSAAAVTTTTTSTKPETTSSSSSSSTTSASTSESTSSSASNAEESSSTTS
ncbi:hypothetical protein JCM10212_001454, partial [Sporobolomyces blumeae]